MKVKAANGLREILKRNRLSQKRMAQALGTGESVVSRWVTGKKLPGTVSTFRILTFLRKYEPSLAADDLFIGGGR